MNNISVPKKNMRSADRRSLILKVACRLFAAASYDTVSIREIAVECGCSPSLIMKFFSTKDDIFRALLAELEEISAEPLVEYIPDGPAIDAIKKIYMSIDSNNSFYIEKDTYRSELLRAITGRVSHIGEYHRIMLKQQDVERTIFLPLVFRGQEEGSIRQGDPNVIAHILVCLLYGSIYLHHGFPAVKHTTFEEIEKYVTNTKPSHQL